MEWSTVWVPAVVAAVVTLAIEYAAKPHLEARKQRIVGREGTRQRLIECLHLGHANCGYLLDIDGITDQNLDVRAATDEEARRLKSELRELAIEVARDARLFTAARDPLAYELLTHIAGLFRGISVAGMTNVRAADLDSDVAFGVALLTRRRWTRKGRSNRKAVDAWLSDRTPNREEWRDRRRP